MTAEDTAGGYIDKSVRRRLTVSWQCCRTRVQYVNTLIILVESFMGMTEKYDLCAEGSSLLVELINIILDMEPVSVSIKDLDLACVIQVGVRGEGVIIAVSRYVEYLFFGVDYPQLIDLFFTVTKKKEGVDLLIAFYYLTGGAKIAVCIRKNYQTH